MKPFENVSLCQEWQEFMIPSGARVKAYYHCMGIFSVYVNTGNGFINVGCVDAEYEHAVPRTIWRAYQERINRLQRKKK